MNNIKRTIIPLCQNVLKQQLSRGNISANGLHNRRRVLVKQVLKRIPKHKKRHPDRLMSAAILVLASWGLVGVSPVEAAPDFVAQAGGLNPLDGFNVGSYAKPSFADIDDDGDLDAFIGESNGTIRFYRNTGTVSAPVFVSETGILNPLDGFDVGGFSAPSFADIDNDGDLDAFVGEYDGNVNFYRNTGTASAPIFVSETGILNPLDGFDVCCFSSIDFADIDDDGDFDAFIGEGGGTVKFFRNDGTVSTPVFTPQLGILDPLDGIDIGSLAAPNFADLDNDGDLDAFIGESTGTIKFYRNTGTASAPVFAAEVGPLDSADVGSYAKPSFADIDNDGDFDAFIGNYDGSIIFYSDFDPQPTLVDDSLTTTENTPATTGDVIANDSFKSDGPVNLFTLTVDVASTQGGTVTNNNDNTFTYLPPIDYFGSDTFSYTLDDGAGTAASATVVVTISETTTAGSSGGAVSPGSSPSSIASSGSCGGCGSLSPWFLLLTGLLLPFRQRLKRSLVAGD